MFDLRYARHGSYDRLVADIRGRRPDFTVGYVRRLHYQGSGNPVRLWGKQKMLLRISAVAHNDNGESLYDGPRRDRMLFPTLVSSPSASAPTGARRTGCSPCSTRPGS